MKEGKDEALFDLSVYDGIDDWNESNNEGNLAPWTKASNHFSKLDKGAVLAAKEFMLPYGKEGKLVTWEIKGSSEDVNFTHFEPDGLEIEIDKHDYFSNDFFQARISISCRT